MTAVRTCLNCGAQRVVPIVYGEPKPATMRAAELGLLITWGCVLHDDLPQWACLACGHRWGRLDDGDARSWNATIDRAMRQARLAAPTLRA